MTAEEKLRKALKALGVKGTIKYKPITKHPVETRYTVQVNGEPFGVFDTERETFVD